MRHREKVRSRDDRADANMYEEKKYHQIVRMLKIVSSVPFNVNYLLLEEVSIDSPTKIRSIPIGREEL